MDDASFQKTVSRLFKVMDLKGDPTEAQSVGYTVSVGQGLQIELIGMQEGFLNMLSVVGTIPDAADSNMLKALLYGNQFTFDHPQVCLGADPKTGNIMLWTRQALKELDDKAMLALFGRFTHMADLVRQWLAEACPRNGTSNGINKGGTSERLQRLKVGKPAK
jgi:hypothetical protein